jgi:hypothetical protein
MQLLGQSTDRWLNPEHSQQQAARKPTEEQASAASAQVLPAGDSNGKESRGSSGSQAEQGTGVEAVVGVGVAQDEPGRGGGAVQEQAAVPDDAQPPDSSSS